MMRPQEVPVNVWQASDALVVVAALPAVQPEDVAIDLWPGRLRITAALRSAPPRDYLVHEWDYGGFERELDLPDGWGGGAEASLANGQLACGSCGARSTGAPRSARSRRRVSGGGDGPRSR